MKKGVFAFVVLLFLSTQVFAEEYLASRNSTKYHKQTCRIAKRIKPDNVITFASPEDAANAGYEPCKICKPPVVTESKESEVKMRVPSSE